MNSGRHIVFLVNLLQDVNVIRPLAYLAGRETDCRILYLLSTRFLERDNLRTWQREMGQIAGHTGGEIHIYETPLDALAILQNMKGIIVAASESTLNVHAETHNVFRVAPPGFIKVTLQHGYECVGFLLNREHVVAHGRNIKFAADIVCGWCEAPALTSLAPSERPKLYVSGPPMVLNQPRRDASMQVPTGGLVCENLHSARLKATGDHGKSFMENFDRFCAEKARERKTVNLRPHPGGMYVIKNNVPLPPNVALNSQPMYKTDLRDYAFGISAPSTVVLDMVLAGIPVAVWRDEQGIMDASNYDGLTPISGLEDWIAFAREAQDSPETFIARQRGFLGRLAMPADARDVYGRFARLFNTGTAPGGEITSTPEKPKPPRRIALVANALIPTLQLSFLKPLAALIERGDIVCDLITEVDSNELFPLRDNGRLDTSAQRLQRMGDWIEGRLKDFAPDLIVACRYSAPCSDRIVSYARSAGVPLVYHIDDDLLNIPREIGEKKFLAHNNPNRLRSVDTLLKGADFVYASTARLKARLRQLSYRTPMTYGEIYCSGRILSRAERRTVTRVGYMGFDHAHDFEIILPQLVRYLRRNPEIEFELFGSIPKPDALNEFGERIHMIEPVRNYEEFLNVFATRNWDIGLCPLAVTPFNPHSPDDILICGGIAPIQV
ncbi:hypothetical protein [Aestuariivirga sp.]|uniref:hypothetical protein n=1 Tax=Aestuariivirga sp. TaxID=2650926 RepID=UPI00359346CB